MNRKDCKICHEGNAIKEFDDKCFSCKFEAVMKELNNYSKLSKAPTKPR